MSEETDSIDWQARAERAEKACAEMREALKYFKAWDELNRRIGYIPPLKAWYQVDHVLSTDCGSGYVRREELELLERDNRRLRKELDAAHEELFAHAKVAARVEADLKKELDAAKAENARLREALNAVLKWSHTDFNRPEGMFSFFAEQVIPQVAEALAGKEGE